MKSDKIIFEISSDEAYLFFQLYDQLGETQRKIWKAAVWWCRRFPKAFPNQRTVADHVGCSRKHVNRTFSLFKKHGWVRLISRGRKQTKILSIPYHLIQLDVVKREYHAKVEVTSKVTHSKNNIYINTSSQTGDFQESKKKGLGIKHNMYYVKSKTNYLITIPIKINSFKISYESKLKLSLLPENCVARAIEKCKWKAAHGFVLEDRSKQEKYCVETAIKMAENEGYKIEWWKYYKMKELRAA